MAHEVDVRFYNQILVANNCLTIVMNWLDTQLETDLLTDWFVS